ncbi:hypothetical protein [Hymenobacter cellulosilyticus]|uniref:Uncharacterized protein n=1 Tax=Hymenobacter cellulosilyticus TaxID=2932248 RepID=A0A8T9Q280_9BACT|nr:hypothetical protein [Hymenobacter cellulosilyticus]UOQ71537.1 hypothetical protein MUN79_23440 [Hymenobacter cellulosilyticus]
MPASPALSRPTMYLRSLLVILLGAALVLCGACRKTEPAPAPHFEHAYSFRTILGVEPAQAAQLVRPAAELQGTAQQTGTTLALTIKAGESEELVLSIPREQLAAGLSGTYALRDPAYGANGPVTVHYTYVASAGGNRQPHTYTNGLSAANPSSGSVVITQYDARHGLLSGTYHVDFAFVPSPLSLTPTAATTWQLALDGRFENVKLL